jgi:hypothetical protein
MALLTLADVLPDFGPRTARPAPVPGRLAPEPAPAPKAPLPDVDALVAAAVARAEDALESRLAAEHAATLEAAGEAHAAECLRLQRELGEKAAAIIATRLDAMEQRIADTAAAAAARLLGSVLSDDLRRRSVESLARSIREAASDREAVRIRVHGPQSLFESLRDALGEDGAALDFAETASFDLTVSIDGSLLETRLGEWASVLAEALS